MSKQIIFIDSSIHKDASNTEILDLSFSYTPFAYNGVTYDKWGISEIKIWNDEKYINSETIPVNPNYSFSNTTGEIITSKTLQLTKTDLGMLSGNIHDHIWYIYVKIEFYGDSTSKDQSQLPCGTKQYITVPTCNLNEFYNTILYFIRQINDKCCDIPMDFINYLLRYKALKFAIAAGNYDFVNELWLKYFSKKDVDLLIKKCGCNHG